MDAVEYLLFMPGLWLGRRRDTRTAGPAISD